MTSLHDHPTSRDEKPPRTTRDVKPREQREKKAPGDMKGRHRAERAAMYEAHRVETRDMGGNHIEEKRRMMLRHEKGIADLQEKQEREMTGAPRISLYEGVAAEQRLNGRLGSSAILRRPLVKSPVQQTLV